MSDVAIRVAGLGKQYRLGGPQERYHTLGDQFRKWTSLRRLLRRRTRDEKRPPFWALKDVSFEVKRGEVVGVIGRNGAGKSTLLKILSRITEPTEGEADIHGRVGSLLEVGTGFHPELTGRENVYLNGAILGMRRTEIVRKFDEIVSFAEVEKFIDTPVKHYSSGMYMRLAFAVAAHLEPEILIVDEVLAVGDAEFQKKCLGKMGDVAKGGRTVLFVSHNLGQIRALCRRGVWLEKGQVVADDLIVPITERYLAQAQSRIGLAVELRNAPRAGDRSVMRLTRLTVNGGSAPRHGEPFEARIAYEVTAAASAVSFGVGFATQEGVRLYTVETDYTGERFEMAPGSRGAVTIRVAALPLQPAIYTLDLGARSGDRESLDYLPGCTRVEVMPGPQTPTAILRNESTGCVRAQADQVTLSPEPEQPLS